MSDWPRSLNFLSKYKILKSLLQAINFLVRFKKTFDFSCVFFSKKQIVSDFMLQGLELS